MQQNYNINIDEARKGYMPDTGRFSVALYVQNQDNLSSHSNSFSAYSPAYITSNEQVREIIDFLQPAGKTALAVAGSGDIPLFLTAYDAVHVDTFDISYNARIIMDIKAYMLQNKMYLCDYMCALRELSETRDALNCKFSDVVRNALSPETLQYLDGMRGCKLFSQTSVVSMYNFCPDAIEFDDLQHKVHGSYNFIWSDLFDVCEQIKGKSYDIIYLSNVLQYTESAKDIISVVNNLRGVLNPKGVMVLDSLMPGTTMGAWTATTRWKKYDILRQAISSWAELIHDSKAMALFLRVK